MYLDSFHGELRRPMILSHVDHIALGDTERAGSPTLIIQQIFLKHLLCGRIDRGEQGQVQWERWVFVIWSLVTKLNYLCLC